MKNNKSRYQKRTETDSSTVGEFSEEFPYDRRQRTKCYRNSVLSKFVNCLFLHAFILSKNPLITSMIAKKKKNTFLKLFQPDKQIFSLQIFFCTKKIWKKKKQMWRKFFTEKDEQIDGKKKGRKEKKTKGESDDEILKNTKYYCVFLQPLNKKKKKKKLSDDVSN